MQLPSIQLDDVIEDRLNATRAQVESTQSEPFSLADGMQLVLAIDGTTATATINAVEFYNVSSATLEEVIAAIRPTVLALDGEVFRTQDSFGILSSSYGLASAVSASGTAASPLGLTSAVGADGDSGVLLIANRNPQPNEPQIPLTASVEFDVIRIDGVSPADDFEVTVDGKVVWSGTVPGGSFENGFFGSVQVLVPDAATTRFVLEGGVFENGQVVAVTVTVNSDRTFSWSFVTYDTVPPLIATVTALNKDQLRVEFNEPVAMADAAASNDALNAANYVIERVSMPAATPAVACVERVNDRAILLTTSFELTFGAQYMLVVSDVADEFDNTFTAPDNAALFAGWLPPFPAGRRFLLHRFVPSVSLHDDEREDLRIFLGCLQDTVNLLLHLVDKWADIIDPDLAPESFLDAMLADLGNPFAFELTLETKRKLAKVLVRIYQLSGTVPGIVATIRFFLGIDVEIEIFNGRGWRLGYDKLSSTNAIAQPNPVVVGAGGRARYSFRITTDVLLTAAQREQILVIAQYMKGAAEHVVGIRDATVLPVAYRYWKLGVTKMGYAKLAN